MPGLYLAFAGIELAGAAVQYEPAFATVNAYFDAQRRKALLTITMVAGLASIIFLPASALLISRLGWCGALLILAAVQAATAVPHVLLLRRRPSDHGWQRDGVRVPSGSATAPAVRSGPARVRPDATEGRELSATLRSGPVAFLTAGAVLGSAAIAAVAVLFLTCLRQGGYTLAAASAAAGTLGFVQIGGRAVLTVLARRMSTAVAAAVMLAAQAAGVAALLLVSGLVGVVAFVVLFGLGFGVLNIARSDMLAQYAPRRLFARLSGIQASLVITAEASGPTAAAALRAASGTYTQVFAAVAFCSLGAALLLAVADRAHRRPGLRTGEPDSCPGGAAARPGGSASIVPIRAEIGTRAGEPGRTRARLAASSRRARSSSPAVSAVTSWSRIAGRPGAVFLLGYHFIKRGFQAGLGRRYWVLPVEERDRVRQLAAIVAQLIAGHGVVHLADLSARS